MADEKLGDYFFRLTQDELIPSLGDSPIADLAAYRDRIGQRFANPLIHHELKKLSRWFGKATAKIVAAAGC